MADLLINGTDAASIGVRMGDNFLSDISAPAPLKEFIENKSRMNHGKEVIYDYPRKDERDVTLSFNIVGSSTSDLQNKLATFNNILFNGKVTINVPSLNATYILTYLKSQTYAMSFARKSCKISVKFNEPNPNIRT